VFLPPVFQNLPYLVAPRDREIHAARLMIDMVELQTCFAYGRVAHNREKARRVGHDRSIEERFVVVEQIVEMDVAFEVRHFQRPAWVANFAKNRRARVLTQRRAC